MQGRVVSWSRRKGYGFIRAEGNDYYVGFPALSEDFIDDTGKRNLEPGITVCFDPRKGRSGLFARNVRVEEEG